MPAGLAAIFGLLLGLGLAVLKDYARGWWASAEVLDEPRLLRVS